MKARVVIFVHLFTLLLFVGISGCIKPNEYVDDPFPLSLEILDQSGKSLITSINDDVKVTYIQNGETHTFNLKILKLVTSMTDTTTSLKYNGLFVTDGAQISWSSAAQKNAIRNFTLFVNGVNLGNIYFYYYKYVTNQPPSVYFTFNGSPVNYDTSRGYFSYNFPLSLLQVK